MKSSGRFSIFTCAMFLVATTGWAGYSDLDSCSRCVKKGFGGGFSVGTDPSDVYVVALCIADLDGTIGNCETYNVDATHESCRSGASYVSYGNCSMGIAPLPGDGGWDPFRNWPSLIGLPTQMNELLLRLQRERSKI